ncbi:Uncharacterised protein [Salmonella enterica subsp. enterica]|uniref:Uncharacterized protein n=1 Tax=Salmonella enterica I TaxID=59201 RepID=A0A3S4EXS4_SALET|nr:Uncharacterised protein [Salmonella enterica subsp. enterica]
MQTIQYEELRSAIRDIVAETPPQAHEVTRVLEKMSEIASNEEASTLLLIGSAKSKNCTLLTHSLPFTLSGGLINNRQNRQMAVLS